MDKGVPLNPPPPGFNTYQAPAYPPPDYSGPAQQTYVQAQPAPQVTFVRAPLLGSEPAVVQCPTCQETVQTQIIRKASGKTHLIALLLCVFQCWICIPCVYCADSLQDANHHCPNCNTYLGTYSSI